MSKFLVDTNEKIYQMNNMEDKTEQIKQIISEWFVAKGKIADEKNINHIIGKLSKSLQLIENEYHITCHWDNLDGNEQKIGNRVCLIYDKEHYFLMRMAEPNSGKVFAPHVDRESALQTFNELENNGDIQFENE